MRGIFLTLLFTLCMVMAVVPISVAAGAPEEVFSSPKSICANGTPIRIVAGTTLDFTNILYDMNNDGVIEDGERLTIGDVSPTPAGYDLSGYTIFGGAKSGTITSDIMITVDGGKVGSIYGANRSYSDMGGGVTIVMNGGSVARLLACGYNNAVGGSGKTVSISIHGGTVRGGEDQSVNLASRNNASITSLFIDGGTINGRIAVKSSGGSFVIKGGNILNSIDTGTPVPTDGSSPVYKATITLNDGSTVKTNAVVSALTTDAGYTYKMTDVITDKDGKIFVYLPAGKKVTAAYVDGICYVNSEGISIDTSGKAMGILTKVMPQPTITAMQMTAENALALTFSVSGWDALTFTSWISSAQSTPSVCYSATLSGTFEPMTGVSVRDNGNGTGTLTCPLPSNTSNAFFRVAVE